MRDHCTYADHDLDNYQPFHRPLGGLTAYGLTYACRNRAQGTATVVCEHGKTWHWDGDDWRRARPWQRRHIAYVAEEVRESLTALEPAEKAGVFCALFAAGTATVAVARGIRADPAQLLWIGAPAMAAVACRWHATKETDQ